MNFSVLMSIYNKERAEYFNRAMQSIWDEQTMKPAEIILVEDGKLTDDLYQIIDKWKNKLGDILKIIPLEENAGLGDALNIVLKYCNYELVARMDTDDISLPYRFEKQIKVFQNSDIDICSSWVSEFENDEKETISYRKVPKKCNEIVNYAKMRNPINHPAVMYKKSVVENAGGYKKMMWFEDYYLWIRMILNGAKFYNLQEVLVNMRAGYSQLERRGGFKYAIEEFKFLNKLRELGFLSTLQFIKSVSIRFIFRILPKSLLKIIYKKIRE
jgi:glycosyltransferase involved in cell wall biosynthesis